MQQAALRLVAAIYAQQPKSINIYQKLKPNKSEKELLYTGRIATIFIVVFCHFSLLLLGRLQTYK